jgi:hypothetical protein
MRNENMRYETTTSFTFTNDGGGGGAFLLSMGGIQDNQLWKARIK